MTSQLPPHSVEAEQAVIGSILIDRDAIVPCHDLLDPDDFYLERYGRIFAAACKLFAGGVPVDLVILADWLARDGILDEVGGVLALAKAITATPTAVHVEYYARIVRDHAERRRQIEQGRRLVVEAWSGGPTIRPQLTASRAPQLFNPALPSVTWRNVTP